MKREKLPETVSPIILLICILAFPPFSFAASPKPDIVGKPQRIDNPRVLQKSLNALLQKAHAQYKIINDWHLKITIREDQCAGQEPQAEHQDLGSFVLGFTESTLLHFLYVAERGECDGREKIV